MDHPSVRTCALVEKWSGRTNISCDSAGRVLLSDKRHGAVLITQGRGKGAQKLNLRSVVASTNAFVSATIGHAGDHIFIAARPSGIWRASLSPAGVLSQAAQLTNVELPDQWRFNVMHAAGPHLYYWIDLCTLMQLNVDSGAVKVAARVPLDVDEDDFPSWALHLPAGAAGTLYYKRDCEEDEVHVIQLGSGAVSTNTLPAEGSCAYLQTCTGDGKLVISGGASDDFDYLDLWDLTLNSLRRLAGGAESGQPPRDAAAGEQAAFANVLGTAIGPSGELWVFDDWETRSDSRVACVSVSLVPPYYLNPPSTDHTRSGTWEVSGSAAGLLAAYTQLLASGQGADVHIVCAGGVIIKGHSLVLSTHSEWFRARLERWGSEGGGASSSSSGAVCVIDAQEMPAAVMRALLQFVYGGRVELGQEEQVSEAAAASPKQPPAKKARAGGKGGKGGKNTGGSSLSQQAPAATEPSEDKPPEPSADQPQPHVLLAQLLHAAQIYGVPQLHAACLEAARARISVHSALPWLVYAHEQGEQELKQLALDWAAEHYPEITQSAPETIAIMDDQSARLAMELMHAVLAAGGQLPAAAVGAVAGGKRGRS